MSCLKTYTPTSMFDLYDDPKQAKLFLVIIVNIGNHHKR